MSDNYLARLLIGLAGKAAGSISLRPMLSVNEAKALNEYW
jgi:hypothetical protein